MLRFESQIPSVKRQAKSKHAHTCGHNIAALMSRKVQTVGTTGMLLPFIAELLWPIPPVRSSDLTSNQTD